MRGDICALIVVLVLGVLALLSLAHSQPQHQSARGAATLERLLKPPARRLSRLSAAAGLAA